MKLPPLEPKQYHMGNILEQGVAAQSHQSKNAQRKQGHGHDHHLRCDRQVEPHQFRVSHNQQQSAGLNGVSGLQHPSHQLS